MIDVPPLRAAMIAADGDVIGVTKAQLAQLLDEVERGQRAECELINIKSMVAVAGMSAPRRMG